MNEKIHANGDRTNNERKYLYSALRNGMFAASPTAQNWVRIKVKMRIHSNNVKKKKTNDQKKEVHGSGINFVHQTSTHLSKRRGKGLPSMTPAKGADMTERTKGHTEFVSVSTNQKKWGGGIHDD